MKKTTMLCLMASVILFSCKKEIITSNEPLNISMGKGVIAINKSTAFLAIKELEVQMETLESSVPIPQVKYQGLMDKRILLLQALLLAYPELKTYKQSQVESTFGYINVLRGGDCQSAYVGEIRGCDNSFYLASAVSVISGVFASFVGTPLVGVGVGAVGISTATSAHFACVMSAIHTRKICSYQK